MNPWKQALRAAFPLTIPVLTGYLFLGLAFGILMHAAGYAWWMAGLASLVIYAGSMQFAAVPLLAAGEPVGAFLLALAVNARHLFYSISMLNEYRAAGRLMPYLVFSLTDETFSVNVAARIPPQVDRVRFYVCTSLLDQLYWVLASAASCALGGVLAIDTTGIEFVMTALFTAIFTEQWLSTREHRPALAGLALSAVCVVLFGPSSFMIPAMALITAALLAMKNSLSRSMARAGAGEEVSRNE